MSDKNHPLVQKAVTFGLGFLEDNPHAEIAYSLVPHGNEESKIYAPRNAPTRYLFENFFPYIVGKDWTIHQSASISSFVEAAKKAGYKVEKLKPEDPSASLNAIPHPGMSFG